MQLNEFRDLLANDGFAATFQTMGQYRTELLRLIDKLRAQADARQVFYVADDLTPEMVGKGCRVFMSTESFTGCTQELYTHPEASAPGLSVEDAMRIVMANWGDKAAIERAFAANLACASRAAQEEAPGLSEFEIRDLAVKYCAYETDGKCYNIVRYEIEEDFFNFCRALISLALARASAATASPDARIEELRKGLFEARDAMRVMSNWVKQSDPAGHSWGVRMVDRANAVLSGASAATVAEPSEREQDLRTKLDDATRATEFWKREYQKAANALESKAAQQQADPLGIKPQPLGAEFDKVLHDNLSSLYIEDGKQQAEPSADERAAFEASGLYDGLMVDARSGFNWGYRAAQSGQRAGVAEKLLVSLCQWLLHRFGPNTPEGEEAQSRLRLIAAAPTQQQEGGDV